MFFRARHMSHNHSSGEEKLAFALHATLGSLGKAWRERKAEHIVICLEGRSWRKDFYPPYKAHRAVARAAHTVAEVEEDKMFFETYNVSDNIFSAFPGVRTKGSSKKVGLQEAFADRHSKGFNWNNMMLQRWVDHNGVEHRVLDDYERNRVLVDLTAQPTDIKQAMLDTFSEQAVHKSVPLVGAHFLKFCGRYDLVKLSESAARFGELLNAPYPESAVVWRKLSTGA